MHGSRHALKRKLPSSAAAPVILMSALAFGVGVGLPAPVAYSDPPVPTLRPSHGVPRHVTRHTVEDAVMAPVAFRFITTVRFQKIDTVRSRGRRPASQPKHTYPTRPIHYTSWLTVSRCESGGDWHINTGNGFYGGLQFTQGTWDSFDTDHFAARADLASKLQQMTVAERVLAAQGAGAWPVCGQGVL